MCGVVGLIGQSPVNLALYNALTVLQHRGQDAAGIITSYNQRLSLRKGNGLVRDVFRTRHMHRLQGNMGIGHVRYPTAGSASEAEAQPFYVNSPYGIALAHNGNLINSEQLHQELYHSDRRHINTDSDSEVLLNIFAHELLQLNLLQPSPDAIFQAVSQVHKRCIGAYAALAVIAGYGIVAFRDPNGIRPLVYGQRKTEKGVETMFASESVALDVLGFDFIDDVAPGQAIVIDLQGKVYKKQCAKKTAHRPCLFEYVYFARPDSIIDQISVYKTRLRMGEKLADKILREWPDHDIDVIIPIPDTSRTAALPLSYRLGLKFREGLIKNRYIGRTFIMPGQSERRRCIRQKLNTIELEFQGKNVLLVDDSIVRGTTSKEIIQMARDAGAKKVYFASAAPPVRYPNVYGIDIPVPDELIAANRSVDEVCKMIGADKLIYQDLDDILQAASEGNPHVDEFEASVFDGRYTTGQLSDDYLEKLRHKRSDQAKQDNNLDKDENDIGLYQAE